ncbi:4Fe-4S binding protein [Plebeiibacterium sediminum]|uniref:4Fe-4S binding protein n=1 Tax=Plebeiibacterium sediminum TaxID=2992112 RepID=A0AAE3M1D6_9BACT|nr:4Fe-4S binding protein [Plebeiobacterium sediminum]MCW3785333.1 4Fe-4S binding protein [Plebeiobacterium sediminum]
MLKKIRIGLATLIFSLITLLFLDFTGTIHHWFGWLAKIQFIPAILGLHVGLVVILVLLTLAFGRIYCSVICPLGVWQDIVSWFAGKRKKRRFNYSAALNWLRYTFLAVFIVALLAGISAVVSVLDPYGAYGRIASNMFSPLYQWGNNLIAYFAARVDSYTFYGVDVWIKSIPAFLVAVVMFLLTGVLAWKNGRTYCNTVCPVGTVLGFISRYSYLKPVFNTEKCNGCNLCARNCKASCIDTKNQTIDYSRCVTCMDCIESCNRDAMTYRSASKVKQEKKEYLLASSASQEEGSNTRRSFLTIATALALSPVLKAQEKVVEGGVAVIKDKKIPNRTTPITPPGSGSSKHFTQHCTSCSLCVSACPNGVLRPSSDLKTFMQPVMTYERGFCRPECTSCSEVCPTGAINLITKEDKSSTQIGYAVWIKDNCVVLTDDVDCGNCADHCPTGAIEMIPSDANNEKSRKIPAVNTERCIGCGACEYLCPSRPLSAIYVEGTERHRNI